MSKKKQKSDKKPACTHYNYFKTADGVVLERGEAIVVLDENGNPLHGTLIRPANIEDAQLQELRRRRRQGPLPENLQAIYDLVPKINEL